MYFFTKNRKPHARKRNKCARHAAKLKKKNNRRKMHKSGLKW